MHLASHLRKQRQQQGISLGELARRIGYQNISKGCRRLDQYERTGQATPKDLPQRVALVLSVSDDVVRELAWLDYSDWQEWLNEPVPIQLIVRMMAGVYCDVCLPSETTVDEAELWAGQFAKEQRRRACLIVSRRLSVWFDEQGKEVERSEVQSDKPNSPFMQIGGRQFFLHGE